jgi:hypothetical protein
MTRIILLCCVIFLLGGCVSIPPVMVRAGSGLAELEYDKYECDVEVKRGPFAMAYARDPLGNLYYPIQYRQEMLACLQHKGWTAPQP